MLYRLLVRSQVLAYRELERSAVGERVDALDETLAKRGLTYERRTLVVMERRGEELGAARGASVDEHRERFRRQLELILEEIEIALEIVRKIVREIALEIGCGIASR